MPDEVPPSEVPSSPPVQIENPPPPPPNPAATETPPAANLVINGEVKSERELQLERQVRQLETEAAESQRMAQDALAALEKPVAPPSSPKKCRFFPTILGAEEET